MIGEAHPGKHTPRPERLPVPADEPTTTPDLRSVDANDPPGRLPVADDLPEPGKRRPRPRQYG